MFGLFNRNKNKEVNNEPKINADDYKYWIDCGMRRSEQYYKALTLYMVHERILENGICRITKYYDESERSICKRDRYIIEYDFNKDQAKKYNIYELKITYVVRDYNENLVDKKIIKTFKTRNEIEFKQFIQNYINNDLSKLYDEDKYQFLYEG